MPGLRETLELIVSANVGGAVSDLERVGKAADRDIGKADDRMQKFGGRLQATGGIMIGTGAVLVAGLAHVAQASEEAELVQIKLQNSIANNPKVAGESTAAFEDLATALMGKTVADDESIKSGQAMLLQFGLTKDEVLGLTPLVVDLSRKMGVDMDTAAKTVGKAIDGNSGALKRMGVSVDETAFKTDKYAAVQDALARTVGGFAEAEGKTFSGQLQIMQNQLGELQEGVGVGVVDAFSKMFGAVDTATGALNSLSPSAQSTIGEIATFGSVGLIAVGAFNLAAGTIIKFVGNLGQLKTWLGLSTAAMEADTAATTANTASKTANAAAIAKTLGPIGLVTAGLYAAAAAAESITASDGAEKLGAKFEEAAGSADFFRENLGDVLTLSDAVGNSLYDTGKTLAETSIPAARNFAQVLEENGRNADDVRRAIDDVVKSGQANERAQQEQRAAMEGTSLAAEEQAESFEAVRKAQEGLISLIGQVPAALQKSYDATTSQVEAHSKYEESIDNLTESLKTNLLSLDDSTEGGRNNIAALLDTGDAVVGLIQRRFEETQSIDEAKAAGALYVENLKEQLRQSGFTEEQVQSYIDTMNLTPEDIDTIFSSNAVEQQVIVGKYLETLDKIPPHKQAEIETLLAQGKYGDALQVINAAVYGVNAIPGYKRVDIDVVVREDSLGLFARDPGSAIIRRRWGGVDNVEHAATGRLQAGVVDDPTILFGERETGGEAFIPRVGNPSRSRAILEQAAGWYGLTVGPEQTSVGGGLSVAGGGSTTYAPTYNFTINGANMTPDEVIEAAKKYEQRNGAGWRN